MTCFRSNSLKPVITSPSPSSAVVIPITISPPAGELANAATSFASSYFQFLPRLLVDS